MRPSLMVAISALVLAGGCSRSSDPSPTLAEPLQPSPAAIAPAPYIPDDDESWPYLIPIRYERTR
jgi:hypothetical protein